MPIMKGDLTGKREGMGSGHDPGCLNYGSFVNFECTLKKNGMALIKLHD